MLIKTDIIKYYQNIFIVFDIDRIKIIQILLYLINNFKCIV